jgi:hypothetical protein
MVSKVENIKNMNPKSKKILVVSVVLAVAIIGTGFVLVSSGNKKTNVEGNASLPNNPGNISSIPGQSPSMRYNQIVQADNKDKAQQALNGNGSFVPTLTNDDAFKNKSPLDMVDQKANTPKPASEPVAQVPVVPPVAQQPLVQAPAQQPIKQEAPVKKVKYSSEEDLVLMTMIAKNSLPESSLMEQDYSNKNKMAGGNTTNAGGYTAPTQVAQTAIPGATSAANTGTSTNSAVVLAKAGDMFNAILETSINSDETSPVFAKIITGPFKGARLIGSMGRTGEKVTVTFSKINIPNSPKSYSISAVAVDPETSRSALATDVDHHYFVKYALGLGAAFIQGYGDAIQRQNTDTVVSALGSVTTSTGQLSNGQIAKQALGQVGDRLSSDLQGDMNRPVTVTVDAGTPIGIMLMDDLTFR